ncbi:hypothetical protein BLA29_010579, partial [Euroglyphus maynei]
MISHYIVANPQIRGNMNKIMEIKRLLPSRDRHIIESLDLTTCNMTTLLNELDNHYVNPNRIVPAIVNRIRRTPFLPQKPSEKEWEAMVELVIIMRKILSKPTLVAETRGLIGVLLQKVDDSHFMNIGNRREMTLDQILEYLKVGLDRKRIACSLIANSTAPIRQYNGTSNQPGKSTNKNVMVATSSSSGCMFGDGDHKTENCPL